MADHDAAAELKYRWLGAICSENGPSGPSGSTVRHVLMALARYMDKDGADCFPSVRRLEVETGLSRRTLSDRLAEAERTGWLVREVRGGGQGWRRHQYTPAIPDVAKQLPHEAGEATSPRRTKRGEATSHNVGKLLPLTSSTETSSTQTGGFDVVWSIHRRGPKAEAKAEYRKAVPARVSHDDLVAALRTYVRSCTGTFRGLHLFRWIRDSRWQELEGERTADPAAHVRNPGLLSRAAG